MNNSISSFLMEPAARLNSLTRTFREHPKIASPIQVSEDGSIMMDTIEVAKLNSKSDAEKALEVRKWIKDGSQWKISV